MQKSCKYCGGIHDESYNCPQRPVTHKKVDDAVRFRNTTKWQKKRTEIKRRDKYLCQICIREMYNTLYKYTYKDLQVHHVIPIHKDGSKSLDSSNLISLCPMHHAMCDKGEIPYEVVQRIINEQEDKHVESN